MMNVIKLYFVVGGINVLVNTIGAMAYYYYAKLRGDKASKTEKVFLKRFDTPMRDIGYNAYIASALLFIAWPVYKKTIIDGVIGTKD